MRQMLSALRLLAVAAAIATPALAAAEQPQIVPDREAVAAAIAAYRLGSGDRVKISVFGESDLSGTFEVSSTQMIAVPLIGEVKAGGLTTRQLEVRISEKFLDGYLKDPQVAAEVVNYRPFYIIGEVNRPGSYAYVNGMTVLNAVALGGGFTHRAREETVWLTRATDPARKEARVEATTIIMPGDVVRVDERFF